MPKRIGNIYQNIYTLENLKEAHKRARKDKAFYTAVRETDAHLEERLLNIQDMLKNHKYKVSPYKTSRRNDGVKERILYKLPYYPDRIIQWAIMLQTEKYFRRVFEPFVCASLPGRGIHYGSLLLSRYINEHPEATKYYLKIDIKKFYPNIDREILKNLLTKLFKDKDLLYELYNIIDSFDNNDVRKLNLSAEEMAIYCQSGKGIPVGSYLSQYLANFYLSYFDHWLKEECGCRFVVRYMDDIIVLSNNKEFLHNLLCSIKIYLKQKLKLIIKPNYYIAKTANGIDFVGFKHFISFKLLRKRTLKNFKKILKPIHWRDLICEKQYHQINSIVGWLVWANSFKFSLKYFLQPAITTSFYYSENIKNKDITPFTDFLLKRKEKSFYDTAKKCSLRRPLRAAPRDWSRYSLCAL